MRIDELTVQNFKKYDDLTITLDPHFTLLVGGNGAGKTTILDALAVAAGVWLVDAPDSDLVNSRRNILTKEIRLEAVHLGDRTQFRQCSPVRITARGKLGELEGVSWTRQIRAGGNRTSNTEARQALEEIRRVYSEDSEGRNVVVPVLAYYGAGRAWLPSNKRVTASKPNGPAKRWAAFYDCFNERIRFEDLHRWFERENMQRSNLEGRWRPGFEVVRRALMKCIPGSDDIWFDADYNQIVLSIDGSAQPFDNLSAGQRMMLALVADLAIRAVTQNAFLVPAVLSGDEPPVVLGETPGLVLIDELDVHLHPNWQRRVTGDLKRTFPGIQFVCTSHSPQVIGELNPQEIRLLDENQAVAPPRSFGIDSSRVLEEIMSAKPRNPEMEALLARLAEAIDQDEFSDARKLLSELAERLGEDDPEVTRSRTLLAFLEDGHEIHPEER